MASFIKRYFPDSNDSAECYHPPASNEQIELLETQLGFSLPADYKIFLLSTNGFEGWIGPSYARFASTEEVLSTTLDFSRQFFPWAIFLGSDGGGVMYILDTRFIPMRFGVLEFIADENDFKPLGNSFEQFIKRLYDDTIFTRPENDGG